jgi:hypothetical protein
VTVYVDGEKVTTLDQEAFTWVYVPEGKHTIGASWSAFKFEPQVKMDGYIAEQGTGYIKLHGESDKVVISGAAKEAAMGHIQNYSYERPKKFQLD